METRTSWLALALIASLAGCTTESHGSIEVFAVCALPDDAEKCEPPAGECDKVLGGRPWVSTQQAPGSPPAGPFVNELALIVQFNNQMTNNADEDASRVNTNDFTIEEYRLSYTSTPPLRTPLGASVSIPSHTFKTNQPVPAEGALAPFVKLIPWEVMYQIIGNVPDVDPDPVSVLNRAIVEVELRAFGHTQGGVEIETAPFVVPVEVFDEIAFDPGCVGTGVFVAACPHIGQPASIACE
jgi:hypothetical protein